MQKKFRRLSFALAALLCLQGFCAAEDGAPTEMQPAVTPASEAGQEPTPAPGPVLHRFECRPGTPAAVHTRLRFAAEFSGGEPIVSVEFYVDGVLAQETVFSGAETCVAIQYETDSLAPGEHRISVSARDALGRVARSDEMTVLITEEIPETPNPEGTPEVTFEPEPTPEIPPEITPEPAPEITPEVSPEITAEPAPEITPEPTPDGAEIPEVTADPAEDQLPEDLPTEEAPEEIRLAPRDLSALWRGVKPSDERGMAIPMLLQGDYDATVLYYYGVPKSVATSGCGATSLSMVIAYLTGNTDQNPYKLFCDSVEAGCYHGAGWSHGTLSRYAAEYGVQTRWIANDGEAVLQALREGKPVIAHMGPGIFTEKGHYLVLRGVTEEGLVLMNDPNSRSNCGKAFPMETLLKQAKTSTAFLVCWVEEASAEELPEERLWGDLNGTGKVDVSDAQLLYDGLKQGQTWPEWDLNGDGEVNGEDLEALTAAILAADE